MSFYEEKQFYQLYRLKKIQKLEIQNSELSIPIKDKWWQKNADPGLIFIFMKK